MMLRRPHIFYLTATEVTRKCFIDIRWHLLTSTKALCQYPREKNQMLSFLYKHPTNRQAIQQIHSHLITNCSTHCTFYMSVFNALIRCYSLGDFPLEAFVLFKNLQHIFDISSFDSFTYSFLLNTCADLQCSIAGTQLQALTMKLGFECHVYVQTALVLMYGVCGSLLEATKVFYDMPEKNSITWNVMISNLVKWNEVVLARSLLDKMPTRTVISWTAIIDGYTRMNKFTEALHMFQTMIVQDGIKPSEITILAILPAIGKLGAIKICQSIHCYCEKRGFKVLDIRVTNCLVDTYSKCGCIMSASRFFMEISAGRKNLVSWTSIISAYAMHGMGKEAVENFQTMEKTGLKPNRVTFLSVLNACSHGGLVDEGLKFFRKMVRECEVKPDVKHYGCLVDMLGRAGKLKEAEEIALEVPEEISNVVIWRTLLGACSFHNDVEMGERVTKKILVLERRYGGDYVLMSNIFASVGRFGDVEQLRVMMDNRNAFKVPGHSFV